MNLNEVNQVNQAEALKFMSDNDLVQSCGDALRRERASVTMSIALLGEIVRRDLHTRLGYPSVYAMLTKRFKMAESCASKRSAAVAVARRFPDVMALIESGAVTLSNLSMIARHITAENKEDLIAAACAMTHRDLDEYLVRRGA